MLRLRAVISVLSLAASLVAASPDAVATTPAAARPPSPVGAAGGAAGAPGARPTGPVTAPPPPLPAVRAVDSILNDMVTAVGGATALARHRSLHTTMEITFKGLGITGTAEHYGASGDKALTITEIPNLASTREGTDGTRFWSQDPINGLRLLEGLEAEQARIESAWNAELRMKQLFQKIEASNQWGDNGALLECLTLTPKLGPPLTNCFDAKTHLMTTQKGVRSGPQGEMPFTARLSDWRTVQDVKMAYATEMQVGPLAFMGRVTSVELDVPTAPTLFALPSASAPAENKANADKAEKATGKAGKATGKAARKQGAPATAPPAAR